MYQSINFGVCNINAGGIEKAARLASMAGFKAMEGSIPEIQSLGAEKVQEVLDKYGLFISCTNLPFQPTRDDEEAFKAHLVELEEQAKLAEQLNITRMIMWLGGGGRMPYEENFAYHVSRFKPTAEILGAHGIKLGFEFIGPKAGRKRAPYEFIYTAEKMLTLCEACGENVGLLFDSWHWFMGADNYDVFDNIGDGNRIVNVHVNDAPLTVDKENSPDNPRGLPFESGVIDLKFVMDGLRKIKYNGPVVAEPFSVVLRGMNNEYEKTLLVKESMDRLFAL